MMHLLAHFFVLELICCSLLTFLLAQDTIQYFSLFNVLVIDLEFYVKKGSNLMSLRCC